MVIQSHGEFVFARDARISGNKIDLPDEEKHHLFRVRRIRSGSEIFATDGQGTVYRTRAEEDQSLTITETLPNYGEPALNLHVVCGCLQGDAARDVVQSCVQLGARKLIWVRMNRSQESYNDSKLEKLRRVAIQATKQSGRAWLLEQTVEHSLQSALAESFAQRWVAHPVASEASRQELSGSEKHMLIVGPEGGFADDELTNFKKAGCNFLSLGSNRLRTEWAVAAGIVRLRAMANDF